MKNLISLENKATCDSCKKPGFFTYTPFGADCTTCPICTKFEFSYMTQYLTLKNGEKIDLHELDNNSNLPRSEDYCANCRIIFFTGCTHAVNGCTDNCYNGHIIGKWKDKTTGQIYIGCPQFDDNDDWYHNANNIEIIDEVCPNGGWHCSNGSYKNTSSCYLEIKRIRKNISEFCTQILNCHIIYQKLSHNI